MNFQNYVSSLAVLVVSACVLRAQSYHVSWSTFDGGAGNGAGGVSASGRAAFALTGTVGQSDAGACVGGTYQLGGGFLSGFQKPVGPELTITRSFGAVILTWPAPACAGFRLEASADVSGGPWVDFGEGLPSGTGRFAAVAASAPYQFFRLRKACAGGCPQACRQ